MRPVIFHIFGYALRYAYHKPDSKYIPIRISAVQDSFFPIHRYNSIHLVCYSKIAQNFFLDALFGVLITNRYRDTVKKMVVTFYVNFLNKGSCH